MNTFLLRLVACLFVVSSSSHAALYDRGNGLIYDDVLNITWMQDANYAHTSGYAAANATADSHSGPFQGFAAIRVDGSMGWDAAITWAEQLSYGGFDDWRLPSIKNPIAAYDPNDNNPLGEMGHMYYNNLGHQSNANWSTSWADNVSFTDATPGGGTESFLNVQGSYWYTENEWDACDTSTIGDASICEWSAWMFYGTSGGPFHEITAVSGVHIWPVRDGDVSTVPVPAAAWLFGSALAGLLVARRKRS